MKLHYYRDRLGNFGDDLNPWLWTTLIPDLLDEDDSTLLFGAGTLINDRAPAAPRKVVFGSGVGYHGAAHIDDRWQFVCVRGPLTAQELGLDPSYAITDPAALLRRVVGGTARPTGAVCFMPHHRSTAFADWRSIATEAGLQYLDPAGDVHEIVHRIRGASLVVAEAMHAAIVADAFRVPWVAVVCYEHILPFKWMDWCGSLELSYEPSRLPSVIDPGAKGQRKKGEGARSKSLPARLLTRFREKRTPRTPAPHREQAIIALQEVVRAAPRLLSADATLNRAVEQLEGKLETLRTLPLR